MVFLRTAKRYLETNRIFHVENAHSVLDAVKKIRQEKYDVILSDYQMPLKNGLEFLSMLRASGEMTPFILFTVKESAEVIAKALNLGVFRYVEKHGDTARVYAELSAGIQQAYNQHENEEWFRAVYDNQQSGTVIIEPSTHIIVGANSAALDLIGATEEQLIGRACQTIICKTEKGKCPITDLGQTVNKVEKVLTKLNSKQLPILKAARKATIAGKEYIIESFVDITERKLEEQELKESRKKFMALFFENPEAVIFCDKNFRAVDVNPSFTSLFGCSPDYIKGRDAIDMFTSDNLKNETNWIKQKLKEGHLECRIKKTKLDGSEVDLLLSGALVLLDESAIGYVIVFQKISDIVVANEELSKLIDEQNVLLSKNSLLNEKLSVTGGLTRHDVRNKLAAINGNAYIAKKRLAGNNDALKCIVQIEEITKNIVRILDFARTYELLGTQEQTRINVGKMVADAASLFADLKGVTVVNECSEFEVVADSLLMELFHNLIDNSLKYGEKITQIRVYARYCEDGTTELIYEDNGVGVDPVIKEKLFQKGAGKGTGYGLYLIKRICEMYGWTLRENGGLGKGVRFVMKIP